MNRIQMYLAEENVDQNRGIKQRNLLEIMITVFCASCVVSVIWND